jgi:hypothetical protein
MISGSSFMPPSAICCCSDSSVRRGALPTSERSLCCAWPVRDHLTSLRRIVDDLERVARLRKRGQAQYFDRRGRARLLDLASDVIEHRPDLAVDDAGDEQVAVLQRAVLHQDRRDGAAAAIEFRFEYRARGAPLRVGFQIRQVRDEQNHLEQLIEVLALPRGDFDGDRRAAPGFRHQTEFRQLTLHAFGVGVCLVDLVHGHHDRHVRRLRVVDRFFRLRHDAVVGRDDQHDDVGDLGAAGAHERERFVTRRIQEHDATAVDVHGVRADVLRDAARFALGDLRFADAVEQRRLAVIDVAHDGDHRGARDQIFRLGRFSLDFGQLFLEAADQNLGPEIARQQ